MTQEERQLLLADLCARLPYKVMVECSIESGESIDLILSTSHIDELANGSLIVKPYLRQMSNMTKEEHDEYIMIEYSINAGMTSKRDFTKWIDFVHSHYLDYRGLIKKGLALEAPEDMYK